MPNIFVERYTISGNASVIARILEKHFFLDCKKTLLQRAHEKKSNACQMRSRGLTSDDEDPLEEQIVDSGEFESLKTEISFSTYSGWDIHVENVQSMARKLPKDIVLRVVGFDMDDYPNDRAAILEVEGSTARILCFDRVLASEIAKKYFPKLYTQLEKA